LLSVLMQALVLASTGLLSLGSMTIVILLLISEQAWRNGLGYALGYACAYTLIGSTAVLLGYRAGSVPGSGARFLPILMMVLGVVLLYLALRNGRRPPSGEQEPPRFFSTLDQITPLQAFGFGAVVSVFNVKNLALFMTAISVVVLSDIVLAEKMLITLLVVLVFCSSVLIPVLITLTCPGRAKDVLASIKEAVSRHRRAIGIWAPAVFGLLFLIKGITDIL